MEAEKVKAFLCPYLQPDSLRRRGGIPAIQGSSILFHLGSEALTDLSGLIAQSLFRCIVVLFVFANFELSSRGDSR